MALPSIPTSEEGGSTSPNKCSRPKHEDPPLLSGSKNGMNFMPVYSMDLPLPGMPVPLLPASGVPSKEWDPEVFKHIFDDTPDFLGNCSQSGLDFPRFSIDPLLPSQDLERAETQTTEATSGPDALQDQSGGSSAAFSAARQRDEHAKPFACRASPAPSPFSDVGQPFESSGRRKRKAVELEQQSSQTIVTIARIQSTAASPSRVAQLEGHRSVEPDLDLHVDVHSVASQLPEIPCNIRLTFNSRLTLAPVLLRGREGFIAANVGVRVHRIDHEPSAQLALHSMLQPSVITTGNPPLPSSCRRRDLKAIKSTQSATTRMSTRTGMTLRQSSAAHHVAPPPPVCHTQRDDVSVEEAILLQRDEASGALLATWHAKGEKLLDGKLLELPDWGGTSWVVDVIARVADQDSSNMWVKAIGVRLTDTF